MENIGNKKITEFVYNYVRIIFFLSFSVLFSYNILFQLESVL